MKFNGISEGSIENITKSNTMFTPNVVNHYILQDVNFNGHCLINNNISFPRDLNTYFRLGNCLIGYVKLTKNSDPDKYVNNGRGIGFNLPSEFSLPDGTVEKKCHYFWT